MKLGRIILERHEGPRNREPRAEADSWEAADAIARVWARSAPTRSVDKSSVTLRFDTGDEITYQYGLRAPPGIVTDRDEPGRRGPDDYYESPEAEIRRSARFYAGLFRPNHLTQAQYDDYLAYLNTTEGGREFVDACKRVCQAFGWNAPTSTPKMGDL